MTKKYLEEKQGYLTVPAKKGNFNERLCDSIPSIINTQIPSHFQMWPLDTRGARRPLVAWKQIGMSQTTWNTKAERDIGSAHT